MNKQDITLPIFFMIYAKSKGWIIPRFHIEVCEFLENYGNVGLLQLPRGHGKSTLLEIYTAYKIYKNPQELILAMSATDSDALKTSRSAIDILSSHPLTSDNCTQNRGTVTKWWVSECEDVKHGNVYAKGILSNITGSRATIIINDDTENLNTTATQELRDKLQYKLGEQTHILIPGGSRLFVGTPHSFDSLYTKIKEMGANSFIRPMYSYSNRLEGVKKGKVYRLDMSKRTSGASVKEDVSYDVFSGIGVNSSIPSYTIINNHILFKEDYPLVDIYHSPLWEDRFTTEVMLQRRKECLSLNGWDSQYMLNSKPLGDSPLEISLFKAYSSELEIRVANRERVAMIGDKKIVSSSLCFDPSSGKAGRDIAAVSLVFKDEQGKLYWHRCFGVTGEIACTDLEGRIIGGQVMQIIDLIKEYRIPCITVETNGIRADTYLLYLRLP